MTPHIKIVEVVFCIFILCVGGAAAVAGEWSAYGADAWNTSDGLYMYVMWNQTGSHIWLADGNTTSVNYLVVAGGGGGGGGTNGGGGGAGGVLNGTNSSVSGAIVVTVGAGGAGATGATTAAISGGNSAFGPHAATGGGKGGSSSSNTAGANGGSGGGGSYTGAAGTGVSGQGYAGGTGSSSTYYGAGGGGGAGAKGTSGTTTTGGNGGSGREENITGALIYYGGGGGGGLGAASPQGTGGVGGGGNAGAPAIAGTDGLGGGGGARGATNGAGAKGGNGTVIIRYLLDPYAIDASFTCTPTLLKVGDPTSCTDTSSGSPLPTTWLWDFGDGNTSSEQNPTYIYPFYGTFSVNLTLNSTERSAFNLTSDYITVTNITSFTQQDIYLTGQYTITFNVKSSTTNLPIANVTVVDSVSGQSYPSTNGTAFLTLPAGLYYVNFIADGYQTKQVTYVVDQDETHEVKMVPGTTPTGGTQNTWYTPWQVRLRIVDYYGMPLSNINVTANYIASTLPSTDTTWLVSAYGVDTTVANDMLNSSVAMVGNTDDNGGLSFTMFKSLQYRLTITNTTLSVASTKTLYPSDQEYVIYVRTAGQGAANNTLAMRNGTLPWYSVNSTHINLNMTYVDTSQCTSQLVFRVWFRDNGTEVHNTTWSGFGASYVYDNHTVPKAPIGTEYLWGYNATTVC